MTGRPASDLAADVPHIRMALRAIGHATTCASVMLNESCDCHHGRAEAELDALVARVDTLTRERENDAWAARESVRVAHDAIVEKEAAEAALADARRALDEISRLPFQTSTEASRIARRALAGDKP